MNRLTPWQRRDRLFYAIVFVCILAMAAAWAM